MMDSLFIDKGRVKFDVMIGTGGIGTGLFFLLDGNHTLGREESRSGCFLDKNDYCKLHIISHYVKALLGENLNVIPLGKTGRDDNGRKLLSEMQEIGLNTTYIEEDESRSTLFSFCFLYPDHSGGNMTTNDSACSSVNEDFIYKAHKEFIRHAGKGIALAAPEVSLEARCALLDLATENKFFRVASFTSGEMETVIKSDMLKKVDLLCINLDEASSILNTNQTPGEIVKSTVSLLTEINPWIKVSVTGGKEGNWLYDGSEITFVPVEEVNVVSTAGAGDAFTAGMIAGIAAGLSLKECQQLANLTGGCSVTSPHTINKNLNKKTLLDIVKNSKLKYSENVLKLLEE